MEAPSAPNVEMPQQKQETAEATTEAQTIPPQPMPTSVPAGAAQAAQPASADEIKPIGSYPPSGIDVLIVGTGLAGLTAALECIRKGHKVRVLERNADINTQGAYLGREGMRSKNLQY